MSEGQWQLEGNAAELFQRYLVPLITTKWAEDLVYRAQLRARRGRTGHRLRHRGGGALGGQESKTRSCRGSRSERRDAGCCSPGFKRGGAARKLDGR